MRGACCMDGEGRRAVWRQSLLIWHGFGFSIFFRLRKVGHQVHQGAKTTEFWLCSDQVCRRERMLNLLRAGRKWLCSNAWPGGQNKLLSGRNFSLFYSSIFSLFPSYDGRAVFSKAVLRLHKKNVGRDHLFGCKSIIANSRSPNSVTTIKRPYFAQGIKELTNTPESWAQFADSDVIYAAWVVFIRLSTTVVWQLCVCADKKCFLLFNREDKARIVIPGQTQRQDCTRKWGKRLQLWS